MSDKAVRVRDIRDDVNVSLPSYKRTPEGYSLSDADWNTVYLHKIFVELQKLNRVFACHNAQDIPNILRRIDTNTKKRRAKRKVKK